MFLRNRANNRVHRFKCQVDRILFSYQIETMEKEVGDMIEKLRFMQEELGLDIPEGVTVEEDEKGFQALQTKILKQISEVKDVYRFSIIVNILVN